MKWYGDRSLESLSEFYASCHESMGRTVEQIRMIQLLKLCTETGEALKEFEGMYETNPRKGIYSTNAKVAEELGDVIGTAMIGLFLFCNDPEKVVEDTIEKFHTRMEALQEGKQADEVR